MQGQVVRAGAVILILCGVLAVTDYVVTERPRIVAVQDETPAAMPGISSTSSSLSSSSSSAGNASVGMSSSESFSTSSSLSRVVKKGVSTKKASGIAIDDIFSKLQLVAQPTSEASFLLLTAPDKTAVKTAVLLRNNDRAFLLSWLDSDNVKPIFASLKQALQEQFSGKVTDLVDETRTPDNGPLVDYLSFLDPALSAERIVFLRVRTRLYELHVAKNGEDLLGRLIEEMSR